MHACALLQIACSEHTSQLHVMSAVHALYIVFCHSTAYLRWHYLCMESALKVATFAIESSG